MVGFRLSLCQAAPLTRSVDRIGKRTGVRLGLFRVPAARRALWERVFSCRMAVGFLDWSGPAC